MTKQEFIGDLKKSLANAPEEVRDEMLNDISEHFSIGALQGLSEDDICKKLGQPDSIALQVMEEYAGAVSENIVTPQQTKNYEKKQGVYDVSIDESFSGVERANINLTNAEIRLKPSSDGLFRVIIEGRSRFDFTVENRNGLLVVKSNETFSLFGLFNFMYRLDAEIYVPARFQGDIKVNSTAGNVTAEKISGNLEMSSTAGNVTAKEHIGNRFNLSSTAGNVKLHLLNAYAETVNISTTAGNAKITANKTGTLNMHTTAGNVKAEVKTIGETKLSSSAGDVKLTAEEVEGNIRISSSAGTVKAYLPKYVNCQIKAQKPSIGALQNDLVGNPQSPYSLKTSSSVGSIFLYSTGD